MPTKNNTNDNDRYTWQDGDLIVNPPWYEAWLAKQPEEVRKRIEAIDREAKEVKDE